jgi:hypothetical protein
MVSKPRSDTCRKPGDGAVCQAECSRVSGRHRLHHHQWLRCAISSTVLEVASESTAFRVVDFDRLASTDEIKYKINVGVSRQRSSS